jgi:hypothetical protein
MAKRAGALAAGVTTLVALALATYAVAAREAGTVASYTGCLKSGKFASVAVGDAPAEPCGPGQTQVRLSGGDVTAVTGAGGLTGGGDSGDLRLGVDPHVLQTRVAGSCVNGPAGDSSISAIHEDGSVTCNPDDVGPSTDTFAGFYDGPVALPKGFFPEPIAELPLPAGRYAISAKLEADNVDAVALGVQCELHAGLDFDKASVDLLEPAPAHGALSLEVVHEFAGPGDAVVSCAGGTFGAGSGRWSFLKINAIRVASVSNVPLTLLP